MSNLPKIMKGGAELTAPSLLTNLIQTNNVVNEQETIRQNQETARQTNTAIAIADAETATERANVAAQAVEDLVTDALQLPNVVTPGTYTKVTVDAKGRTTSGSSPTAIADLGITNVYTKTEANTLESKDNVVTFTEALTDADISSGEKHSTLFGKILKSIKTLRSKLGDISLLETTSNTDLVGAINEINDLVDNKVDKVEGKGLSTNDYTTEEKAEVATHTEQLSGLTQIINVSPVTAVSNIYTLNITTAKNFAIETTDTVAKTITFSNIPSTANLLLSVSVKLKFTNSAAITYPAGVVWKDATAPTFTGGKTYLLLFQSYDSGTTWLASSVGAWS